MCHAYSVAIVTRRSVCVCFAAMSGRDPFPRPRQENDDQFVGRSPPQNAPRDSIKLKPGEMDPWTRLSVSPTLSSHRHGVYHYDSQAPNDSLDFVIKCQYNQSEQFMSSKAETLVQKETLGLPHGRILKNRPVIPKPETLEEKKLSSYCEPRKTTVHSSKGLAIESHHSEATNRGYSRKDDGGFYST